MITWVYIYRKINFNSIMVRLKAKKKGPSGPFFCNFNSIMVRLKAIICSSVNCPRPFQFHYGTIKSKELKKLKEKDIKNFNSIMVRLKAEMVWAAQLRWSYFNSIMVRLKVSTGSFGLCCCIISIPLWYD